MFKYKIEVEYLGTNYSGWQAQDNSNTIQSALEEAVFKFCGEHVCVYGCGRTDAGVHAYRMPAHIEFEKEYDPYKIMMAVNFHLKDAGHSISILSVESVTEDFHARFSCKMRHYVYKICNRPTRPVIMDGRVWWVYHPLDAKIMDKVAKHLIGKHDFSTFRATECQANSPIKTLSAISVIQTDNDMIEIRVSAKSFLYHQVRNIVGSLELVGQGKWSEADFISAFEACDRKKGGPTAPADGLYFDYAEY